MDMGWEHRTPKESRGGFVRPGKEKSVGAVNGALQLPAGTARGRTARYPSKVHSERVKDSNYRMLKGNLLLGIRKKITMTIVQQRARHPGRLWGFHPWRCSSRMWVGKAWATCLNFEHWAPDTPSNQRYAVSSRFGNNIIVWQSRSQREKNKTFVDIGCYSKLCSCDMGLPREGLVFSMNCTRPKQLYFTNTVTEEGRMPAWISLPFQLDLCKRLLWIL